MLSNKTGLTFHKGTVEEWFSVSSPKDPEQESQARAKSRGVLLEGAVLKRGEQTTDTFQDRWISLSVEKLTYAPRKSAPAFGEVPMPEVIGLAVYNKSRAHQSSGDDASSVNILWRKSCTKLQMNCHFTSSCNLERGEFALLTSGTGVCRGRVYVFKEDDFKKYDQWVETLRRVILIYNRKPPQVASGLRVIRRIVRWYYVSDRVQFLVALLILANFAANMTEAQMKATTETEALFRLLDDLFTAIFTLELLVNMFATLVSEFVSDAWNWFDVIVVVVSIVGVFFDNLPGATILRLFRSFRVFRLFKRISSLRDILTALTRSISPMIRAFSIVCLVTGIYAIVGTNFFSAIDKENFGANARSFFVSLYTLFECMTFTWVETARDLMVESKHGPAIAIFFVSFILVVSLVLVNVVIAVLLGEFAKSSSSNHNPDTDWGSSLEHSVCPFERLSRDIARHGASEDRFIENVFHTIRCGGMLNTLVDSLQVPNRNRLSTASVGSNTQNANSDLRTEVAGIDNNEKEEDDPSTQHGKLKIMKLYLMLWRFRDFESWTLNFEEFSCGLKNLEYWPPIVISKDVWEELVVRFNTSV